MSSSQPKAGAIRALQSELKSLKDEPLEGFRVGLANDENLFDWDIAIFGAPGTLYEGGYFKARMNFPPDYPYNPPTLRFLKPTLFHPNVYENGNLCISILHPPIDDPQSGELPCERWNPTQNVRTILLSVISLLNEPNTSSPANVDASVMYRRWRESKGTDNEYEDVVKRQVAQSRIEAEIDGVVVPMTLEEYVIKPAPKDSKSTVDIDIYDDDDYDMDLGDNDSQLTPSDDSHHHVDDEHRATLDVQSVAADDDDELQKAESLTTQNENPTSQFLYHIKISFEYPENEVRSSVTFSMD